MKSRVLLLTLLVSLPGISADQRSEERASLQAKLNRQFALTVSLRNRTDINSTGTVFTLLRENFVMRSNTCPVPSTNTYKNGKLSLNVSFMRDLGGSMAMPEGSTVANCPQQRAGNGTPLVLYKLEVQKDSVVLLLHGFPEFEAPYYGEIKFPFEKNVMPSADQLLATIGEVLIVRPKPPAPKFTTPTPQAAVASPPPVAPAPLGHIYTSTQNTADRLQLENSGAFSLQEGGQGFSGTYSMNGSTLTLHIRELSRDVDIAIDGPRLIVNGNEVWTQPSGN